MSGAAWTPEANADVSPDVLAWSPSGQSLLVYARDDDAPWSKAAYRRINVDTRRAEVLADAAVAPAADAQSYGRMLPRADWMGETALILGRPAGETSADLNWYAWRAGGPLNLTAGLRPGRRRLEAVDADGVVVGVADRLWRIDAAGHIQPLGQASPVTGAGLRVGERQAANSRPSAQALPLAIAAGPDTRAAAVLRGAPREIGVEAPIEESLLVVADKARALASVRRDAHGVETLMLRQAGRPPRALATINAQLAGVDFATPRVVEHIGPHGQALKSWLYLPPGHKAGAKLALLVIPYAGRNWISAPARNAPPASTLFLNAQLLAGAGYAVLLPSLPIDETREPARGLADDILKVVDAAGAVEPDLDLQRLALWGHSYGGWTVLNAATQSLRFKAVIASAFNADMVGHYGRGSLWGTVAVGEDVEIMVDAGWSELGQGRMGVPPWIDPERYVRNSALFEAEKITAPVMLVMGDMDSDPQQSMAMFAALYRQNKDAISLVYHGEGHVYQTPANIADLHARILAFLKASLGPGS